MAESIHQLSCNRGSSFSLALSFANDTALNIDLGHFLVSMEIRKTRASTSRLVALLDESNGRLAVNRTNRSLTAALNAATTGAIAEGRYYYAIKLAEVYDLHTGATKEAFRVIEGFFDVLPPLDP